MEGLELKRTACDVIDNAAEELNYLSQEIWKHPELADQETFAHDLLTGYLEKKGFNRVEKKWLLETAFRATFGDASCQGPHIVVISEYDALPEIGHACGHNLIAEVGIAAGLGIKAALDKSGKCLGRLTVMGTPAEEQNGGKTRMISAGAFRDVDVAMMAHPAKQEIMKPNYIATKELTINYTGREAHASEWPWQGINALDAAVLCYQNISCLRQQMAPGWQVHGIISKGGQRPNIIPGNSQLEYFLRCPTTFEINIFEKKIIKCAEAAANATGCEINIVHGLIDESLLTNGSMIALYEKNALSLGIEFEKDEKLIKKLGGSTDMGNVSHVVPSIHPTFRIGTNFNSHTQEFAPAAGSPVAQPYTLNVAKALAMTAIDILTDPQLLLPQIQKDFQDGLKLEQQSASFS